MNTTKKHTVFAIPFVAQGGILVGATIAITGEDAAFLFLSPSFAASAAKTVTTAASVAPTAAASEAPTAPARVEHSAAPTAPARVEAATVAAIVF